MQLCFRYDFYYSQYTTNCKIISRRYMLIDSSTYLPINLCMYRFLYYLFLLKKNLPNLQNQFKLHQYFNRFSYAFIKSHKKKLYYLLNARPMSRIILLIIITCLLLLLVFFLCVLLLILYQFCFLFRFTFSH